MTTQRYPVQIDCVWIASDRDDHIGAFITAGVGPIPKRALDHAGPPLIEDIEEALLKMPKVSGCRLLASVPRPDSFVEIAERGLFVYDWSDVHRTRTQELNAYEPMAVPETPLVLDELPDALKSCATSAKFDLEAFADGQLLRVRAHL